MKNSPIKRFLLSAIVILIVAPSYSQTYDEIVIDQNAERVREALLDTINAKCLCEKHGQIGPKMVDDEFLGEYIYDVFDKVVLGAHEIIENGTAANISVTEETKFSGSFLYKPSKALALNFGINGNLSNGEAVVVNNKGYFQGGFGTSFGISLLLGKNVGLFDADKCYNFFASKKAFVRSKLFQYTNAHVVDRNDLNVKIYFLQKELDTLLAYSKSPHRDGMYFDAYHTSPEKRYWNYVYTVSQTIQKHILKFNRKTS